MPQRLRIFISSPADVPDERLRADLVVDKLSLDYGRFFTIESYRWEHEAMLASAHFQDAIEPPSAFDIVVLILWSRLGTPLPERTSAREYRGIDGRAPVTGTEWEYEEALQVAREKKAPDLLAFRNISPAPIDPRDPAAQAESMAQLGALNEFWTRHFADKGVFLAAYDEYRTLEEFAQRLEESLRKLIERRIKDASAGEPRAEAVWLGDPFRGLESYEFEHAPIFFGRDAAIAKATEQLAANARAGHAFLLVSGASGSGKSSLVKAGIVPRLMKPQRISGAAFLRRVVFRPGSEAGDVFLDLANALTRAGVQDVGLPELIARGQDATRLASHLRSASGEPGYLFGNALGRLTEAERKLGRLLGFEDAKLILVVDQLEELFTAPGIGPEERHRLVQLLDGLARCGTVWVIATLRADFWHRAADVPELIALAEGQGRIDLAAPSAAELAEMIRKPAQAAGLSFEAHPESGLGLDAVLAEHAATAPGALPLLSFTLDELYRSAKARGTTVLTHESYVALGGLEGAIAKRADEVMASLPDTAQAALPRMLRALTTVAESAEQTPVARPAPLESFPAGTPARALIDAFIAARLLVASDESGAGASVRLAHEALISRWQRARDQLAADRRDLATRMLVERQYTRWNQLRGRARRLLLLRNPDLANAIDLARRWGDEIDAPMRDYIRQSARSARLAQTLTAAAAVLFALVAGGAFFAERQAVRAQKDAENARSAAESQRQRAQRALAVTTRISSGLVFDLGEDPRMRALPQELRRQMFDRAIEGYDQAIKFSPDAEAYNGRGNAHLNNGDFDLAIADFDQAIMLSPNNERAFYNRGHAYLEKGDAERAIANFNEAIKLKKDFALAYVGRGAAYEDERKLDRAAADFSRAITLDPNNSFAYYHRGKVYYDNSQIDLAIADFSKALKLNPLDASVYEERGIAYGLKGDRERSMADFEQAVMLDPRGAYKVRAKAEIAQGDLERAMADFSKAVEVNPNDDESFVGLGLGYNMKGMFDEAIANFNAAIKIEPSNAAALTGRGKAFLEKKDYDRAIADLDRAIALDPTRLDAIKARGNAYLAKHDLDRAIADFDRVISLDPKNAAAFTGRGSAHQSKGEQDQAVADFNRAIALDPDNAADALFGRAAAYEAKGDFTDATDDLEREITLDPEDSGAFARLGVIYLRTNRLDDAIADFDKALRITPQLAEALYGRGLAKLRKGDAVGAQSDIKAAKAINRTVAEDFARRGIN